MLETRRRLDAGLGRIQDTIQRCRMDGKPGEARALPEPAMCTLLPQSLLSAACVLGLVQYFTCMWAGWRTPSTPAVQILGTDTCNKACAALTMMCLNVQETRMRTGCISTQRISTARCARATCTCGQSCRPPAAGQGDLPGARQRPGVPHRRDAAPLQVQPSCSPCAIRPWALSPDLCHCNADSAAPDLARHTSVLLQALPLAVPVETALDCSCQSAMPCQQCCLPNPSCPHMCHHKQSTGLVSVLPTWCRRLFVLTDPSMFLTNDC